MGTATSRKIAKVADTYEVMEGAGVLVRRALPSREISYEDVDPFLLLDFATMHPDDPAFPDHPHRGFEIITYILSGSANHTDSFGNRAEIRAGGAQRITAGKGMAHGEGLGGDRSEAILALQLWINLEKAQKSVEPDYQTLEPEDVPVIAKDGATVKVIVGDDSPMKLLTPTMYLDVTVDPGGEFTRSIPSEFQGFAFVIEGAGLFGKEATRASTGQLVVLGSGENFHAAADGDDPVRFILLAGQPHREPVLWRGPFVD